MIQRRMHVLVDNCRLRSLWDHLGVHRAHVATQMPGDVMALAAADPDRIGSLVLCVPSRLDPDAFSALAARVVMVCGASGLTAEVTTRGAQRLSGARRI